MVSDVDELVNHVFSASENNDNVCLFIYYCVFVGFLGEEVNT